MFINAEKHIYSYNKEIDDMGDAEARRKREALIAMHPQSGEGQRQAQEQQVVQPPAAQPRREIGPAVPIRQGVREAAAPPTISGRREISDKERLAEISLGAPSREFIRDIMRHSELMPTLRRMQLYDMFGPERRESA